MLSMLRDATGGLIAKILLGLLVASFAVWGVSGSILRGAGNSVITVGDTNVDVVEYRLAYDRQLNQIQRQLGTRLTREQAESFGLSGNVLTQLVSGALLDESAKNMGLNISQKNLIGLIGNDKTFHDATGNFSKAQLQRVLRYVGMPEDQYVSTRKAVAVRDQIIQGTSSQATLPDAYWDILSSYQAEERKFNFTSVSDADLQNVPEPDEDQIKAYYEANLPKYLAPEYRKLNIVKLEAADIANEDSVSDEDIKQEYDARIASFTTPEERTIEQLVFTDPQKAEAAAAELKAGTSFETVVEKAGKTLADISLGKLKKSDIPDNKVADAAFALNINAPSDIIDGLFGKVILRVTAIQPEAVKQLEEVRGDIRKSLALTKATEDIFDTHDKLEDERAAGETLTKAAELVGLKARVIEAIDRNAKDKQGNIINDIPQSNDLLAEAFQTDEGVETDPISIGTEGFVWFEVTGITPERQKTLGEVNDQVKADWIAAEKAKMLSTLADTLRNRVAKGEAFNAVIADLIPTGEGLPTKIMQVSQPLKRNGSSINLPANAVNIGFGVSKGEVVIAPGKDENSKIVLEVSDIIKGEKTPITDTDKDSLNASLAEDIVNQMIAKIKENQTVEINQQAINTAFSRQY